MLEKELFLDPVTLYFKQKKRFVLRIENTRHALNLSSSSNVVRENDTFKRRIREAIEIHCQASTLNRDVGHELLAIYRDVLSHDILSP